MDHLEVITYEVFKISIPLEMLQSALSLADVGQNYKMTLAHTSDSSISKATSLPFKSLSLSKIEIP